MRALIVALLLAFASPALAQTAAPDAPVEIKPGKAPLKHEPPAVEIDPEVGHKKPSGFWTGYRPARGGAYRWRMLAVGVGVLALTIFFVVRALRKAGRARATTSSADWWAGRS